MEGKISGSSKWKWNWIIHPWDSFFFFFGWKSSSRLWWIKSPTHSQYTLDKSSASTFTHVIVVIRGRERSSSSYAPLYLCNTAGKPKAQINNFWLLDNNREKHSWNRMQEFPPEDSLVFLSAYLEHSGLLVSNQSLSLVWPSQKSER